MIPMISSRAIRNRHFLQRVALEMQINYWPGSARRLLMQANIMRANLKSRNRERVTELIGHGKPALTFRIVHFVAFNKKKGGGDGLRIRWN
jgi:hypothetical protein